MSPQQPCAGQRVALTVGTWPIEPGQSVWASCTVQHLDGAVEHRVCRGIWIANEGVNSYWEIELGSFRASDQVSYQVIGEDQNAGIVQGPSCTFVVLPAVQVEAPRRRAAPRRNVGVADGRAQQKHRPAQRA